VEEDWLIVLGLRKEKLDSGSLDCCCVMCAAYVTMIPHDLAQNAYSVAKSEYE
jgi:hypothetical protein